LADITAQLVLKTADLQIWFEEWKDMRLSFLPII
jgi:hypothetical protein